MDDTAADTEHKAKLVTTIEGRLPVDAAATEHSEESYALQSTARKLHHSSKLMSTEEEAMIDQVLASEARLLLAKIARKVFLHMPRDTPHHELLQMILELQDTQEQLMLQANTVHTANRKLIQEVDDVNSRSLCQSLELEQRIGPPFDRTSFQSTVCPKVNLNNHRTTHKPNPVLSSLG